MTLKTLKVLLLFQNLMTIQQMKIDVLLNCIQDIVLYFDQINDSGCSEAIQAALDEFENLNKNARKSLVLLEKAKKELGE